MQDHERRPVRLTSFSFDPLTEKPDVPEELRIKKIPKGCAPTIVQFKKSLTREERTHIQNRYGLKLTVYIPKYAYLEEMTAETLGKLSADPLFRASVPFHPAFKIAPGIGERGFRTPERKEIAGYWLHVLLFPEADLQNIAETLEKLGASQIRIIDDRKIGGTAQALFIVQSLDLLPKIAQLDSVRWIEEVAEHIEDNVNAAGTIQSGTANNPVIWNQGLHGEGQVIGLIDSAPPDINHCFFQDPVNNTPGLAHRKILQIRNASGSAAGGHATFTSGCAAGDDFNNPGAAGRRGGAWAARLVCGNNNDIPGINSMLAELNAAATMGAVVHTNSWHDNTAGSGNPATYNQTAADVDTFTWNNEDHLVLGSAGNNGEEQGPPGTAKNAICVGASQADPSEMNFGDGNPGPTADGRSKPDLMAPGCGIQSATVSTACGTGPRSACATSYATPHTAAAAILARQYFAEGWYPTGTPQPQHAFVPSGALLKALLLNSTIDMTGVAGYPSNLEGWGLVQLDNALSFPGSASDLRVWDIRHASGLFTGDTHEYHVDVATSTQPLKVTLVWSEPPGAAASASPVVNNLDLEVLSPDRTQTFRGNVFAGGVSVTGGAPDTLNNVEMALITAPTTGDWAIRVIGTEVNVGNPGQGYAVVVTADILDPLATAIADDGNFGDVCLGSFADQMLTINNRSSSASLEISGINSSSPDFLTPSVISYPLVVGPQDSINVIIRFQPTNFGPKAATLSVISDDPASPHTIDVTGDAPAPRLVLVAANAGNFGRVCVGSFVDEPLILSNSGKCTLSVNSITSSSGEFVVPQVLSYPVTIGAGNFLPVPIRFEPGSFGPKSATLTVISDDPVSPHTIDVSGEAPAGKLAITGSLCFGAVRACCTAERTISICNTGDCKLHVTSVAFKRKSRHLKLVNNPFPATLHPGACLGIVIRYKATEKCSKCSELVVTSDDPITPIKILEVMAYTIWSDCSCKQHCEACRNGCCEKRHAECCSPECYEDCCDDDDDNGRHEGEDDY
ncbi:Serine protease, subtilisin family [Nitrosospira briensis]|uniref:Serine protease, subtilisin family n=1 Tax=Nitrosospira briensis TaxID=35799 RepID=A0A1I4YFH2_9PROT|nr:choice-of-anchor D domain-containing protein [Nitrosospira briensis]SFN36756.1 Serine protease, subtilisin family [Nitrosospira briensis]